MDITPYKDRELDFGKEVYVYRCLNRKGHVYSIKQSGYVVAHTTDITLMDVKFIVNASGKKKAIETKQRNVHAFIKGMISPYIYFTTPTKITYHPFNECGFHIYSTKEGLTTSNKVIINENGVFI